jgi:predicted transcriptional regulator of viral defense system
MARSTYISENLTPEQFGFVRLLEDREVEIFNIQDVETQLGRQYENLGEIVENLAHKGMLRRIEKGKYAHPNFNDPNVIGTFIASGDAAVAYWSALHNHTLTDRFPERVMIKTTRRKVNKRVFGVQYQFVFVADRKFTGIENRGYGNYRYPITNPERTIADCFDQPRYAGPFPDLLLAFNRARLDPVRLIEYTRVIGNVSAIKRIGYLAELCEKTELRPFIQFALNQVNPRYVRFDPLGTEEGEFISQWKLRMNLSTESILNILQSPY